MLLVPRRTPPREFGWLREGFSDHVLLMPSRVKYRKAQRGSRTGTAWRGSHVAFGEFGLQALDRAWVTARQIEACRVALTRHMKRRGKLWIRVFPDLPVTKRPPETRMGKGKGNPEVLGRRGAAGNHFV